MKSTGDLEERNFDYYGALSTGDSSLSACIPGIIADQFFRQPGKEPALSVDGPRPNPRDSDRSGYGHVYPSKGGGLVVDHFEDEVSLIPGVPVVKEFCDA